MRKTLMICWVANVWLFTQPGLVWANEEPNKIPFPVLEKGNVHNMGQYPYLLPPVEEKPHWPELIKLPSQDAGTHKPKTMAPVKDVPAAVLKESSATVETDAPAKKGKATEKDKVTGNINVAPEAVVHGKKTSTNEMGSYIPTQGEDAPVESVTETIKPATEEPLVSQVAPFIGNPAPITEMDSRPAPPKIVVIIDDLGYTKRGMEEALSLPVHVVLAILPKTPFADKTIEQSARQKRTTILHAPMENERELPLGPGGLYAHMGEQEFKRVLRQDLDNVPRVRGINNHMGSLLTTKSQHMEWVMDVMSERSLFFVDSLTSAKSVAYKVAKERGIKTVSRNVFLDNEQTEKAISIQFDKLLKLAHERGSAVAIGHPYPETMSVLKKRLVKRLPAQLVTIDELLH